MASRRQSQGRRREVLQVAARVFHEKGYSGTSIQDVADVLGILKGSLYHYIDSKEDLLFAIIEDTHRSTLGELERWMALETSTIAKLRAFLRWHVISYCNNVDKVGVFLNDFKALSPERQSTILRERDRYDRTLRELIRKGKDEGEIVDSVEPKLASMAIYGMMNWISTWWRPEGPNTPEEVAEQFCDFAIRGLTGRACP